MRRVYDLHKLGRGLNLAVWWSTLHIYVWRSLTEPPNLFSITVIWGPIAKFNSHQYFQLYGIVAIAVHIAIILIFIYASYDDVV